MKPATYRAGWIVTLSLMVNTLIAQYNSEQLGVGIYTSGIKLVGGNADHSTVNYITGISLSYQLSEILTGEISAGLGWVRPRDPDSYFKIKANAPYRTYIYPWSINLRYKFLLQQKIHPYAGIGIGITRWNLRDISGGEKWFPIPESGDLIRNKTNFTFLGNIGTMYLLNDKLGLNIGLRYSHLLKQDLDNIGTGDINNGLIEIRFGFVYFLGGMQDSDGDGIENKYDAEPYQPEDFDDFLDEDGAPDPDNDNDNIPDVRDQAPNLPEDKDGFQDEDGVPDLDNDYDGIPDTQDQCPNESEDFDGFQDEDGCPDPDNDNDGIPDIHDKCPNKSETLNSYLDDDGCPDEKPETIPIAKGEKLILPGVTFPSGKAILTEETKNILDKIYQILRDNTEIRLEIRGFTDSIGSAETNLKISQKRADAVKNYLVKRSISSNRLRSIGYGEAEPIASNKTKEGRAKNRRIELIRLEE